MRDLPISSIRMDGGTQTRAALDSTTCAEYADAMKAGAIFPPVTVFHDGTDYWLADGFHRVEGARLAGLQDIPAEIRQGTQRDARLFAVGANQTHGLRRTNADKRRAASALLDDPEWSQWSDREIARRCGVSNQFVSNMRSERVSTVDTPRVSSNDTPEVATVEAWIPAPNFGAHGKCAVDGVRWDAFIMPSESFESSSRRNVDGNDYLYVVVTKIAPSGAGEVMGTKRPIHRNFVTRGLKEESFPLAEAAWDQFPVSDEPDGEELTFEKRWSWPHLVFETHRDWMDQERWWTLPHDDPAYLDAIKARTLSGAPE